jgi:UDP-2-acetamido-2,6-beta-L-arabino-hexul-4-ose reductase
MKNILITGAEGFIGKNLAEALTRKEDLEIMKFDVQDDIHDLESFLKRADLIFHLAGINRPEKVEDFETGNVGLTDKIVILLEKLEKPTPIVFSSSIQAALDNPYGRSKKGAEDVLRVYSKKNNAKTYIFRLPNVFGKWSRPNYNSVVATFCYNISRNLDIHISDENKELELVYIDDVIREFLALLSCNGEDIQKIYYEVDRVFRLTLGELAEKIYELRDIRRTLVVPDFDDDFLRFLYATYLSFLDQKDFKYQLDIKEDQRGNLSEIIKSHHFGQVFISKSYKGVIRGNHYHNTKIEKFCVVKGKAVIRFRNIHEEKVHSVYVSDKNIEVVDIPPGYTHSIENLSDGEMIVLFWANEIFNPEIPDTYFEEV